ncbi:unnamed protein product, partial [Amoebophrya sp. A25]
VRLHPIIEETTPSPKKGAPAASSSTLADVDGEHNKEQEEEKIQTALECYKKEKERLQTRLAPFRQALRMP